VEWSIVSSLPAPIVPSKERQASLEPPFAEHDATLDIDDLLAKTTQMEENSDDPYSVKSELTTLRKHARINVNIA